MEARNVTLKLPEENLGEIFQATATGDDFLNGIPKSQKTKAK